MNDAQHSAYSAYLRALADALLLRDWEIELLRQWANDGAYADCQVYHKEQHMRVRVCEGIWGNPREQIREWLTHEIFHAHIGRLDRLVEHFTEIVDNPGAALFEKEYDDETEILVQNLARIIAPFMPLPPEGIVE